MCFLCFQLKEKNKQFKKIYFIANNKTIKKIFHKKVLSFFKKAQNPIKMLFVYSF